MMRDADSQIFRAARVGDRQYPHLQVKARHGLPQALLRREWADILVSNVWRWERQKAETCEARGATPRTGELYIMCPLPPCTLSLQSARRFYILYLTLLIINTCLHIIPHPNMKFLATLLPLTSAIALQPRGGFCIVHFTLNETLPHTEPPKLALRIGSLTNKDNEKPT